MRKLFVPAALFLSILLVSASGCHQYSACKNCEPCPSAARDGVLLHVTSGPDNPHRVLMALRMAELMSDSQDVTMYFDIRGIEVLLKDAQNLEYDGFPSSHEQIQKLLAKNVMIMACPGCLKAAGKGEADLKEGVRIADKDRFFSFTKGRILTLDY